METQAVRCVLTGKILWILTKMGVDTSVPVDGVHLTQLYNLYEDDATLARCKNDAVGYGERKNSFFCLTGFFVKEGSLCHDEQEVSETILVERTNRVVVVDVVLPATLVDIPDGACWSVKSVVGFCKFTEFAQDADFIYDPLVCCEQWTTQGFRVGFSVFFATCTSEGFECRAMEFVDNDGIDCETATNMALVEFEKADQKHKVGKCMYTVDEMVSTYRRLKKERKMLLGVNQVHPARSMSSIVHRDRAQKYLEDRIEKFATAIREHLPEERANVCLSDSCYRALIQTVF